MSGLLKTAICALLLTLFSQHFAFGQNGNIRTPCGIGLGPVMDSVPRNVAILVETCGCDEAILEEIGRLDKAFLVSEKGDSVPMRWIEHHKALQEQVLLGPGRHLKSGQRYQLVVPSLQGLPHVDWPDGISWYATNQICESQVGYEVSPKIDHKIKAEMSGAIIAIVGFRMKPLDSTEFYWARITATEDWTGDEIQWLQALPAGQNGLEVGYPLRPCGPLPVFGFENEYRIVITLLGVDGAVGRSSDAIRIAP